MLIDSQRSRSSAFFHNRLLQKCVLITLAAWSLGAAGFGPSGEEDDTPKKWEEIVVQPPASPLEANLMQFYVGPTATQTFFVDEKSVSVSSDGIVRYTLVSKSASGAVNVGYEGIRCETAQRKQYAFGREDGSWIPARQSNWQRISELVANRQHAALAKDYFCDNATVAGTAEQMIKRIKYKHPMSPTSDYATGSGNR